jgi:hypothetical protein
MVKANHWNFQRAAGGDRLPSDLVWIARFDEVRPFPAQDFLDRTQI